MPCSRRILPVIAGCCPFLLEPQAMNLALRVAALSLALALLHLLARPSARALPPNWAASVTSRGTASLVALALAWLDDRRDFPPGALPAPQAA